MGLNRHNEGLGVAFDQRGRLSDSASNDPRGPCKQDIAHSWTRDALEQRADVLPDAFEAFDRREQGEKDFGSHRHSITGKSFSPNGRGAVNKAAHHLGTDHMSDIPPDRLAIDPASPHHDEAVLARGVGVRFKGVDKTNVDEYCVSEGWVRLTVGTTVDRAGKSMTVKLQGPVEPYFRDTAEA